MEESLTTKILITAKTYPSLSTRNIETVCTAGIREDGAWVRIYPVMYRALKKEERFKKYQWIEAKLVRSSNDPRPESYRLLGNIKPLHALDTSNAWKKRKSKVLNNIYTSLEALIHEARSPEVFTSLAVFKPAKITGFTMKSCAEKDESCFKREKIKKGIGKSKAKLLAEHVPYKFYYSFTDDFGKKSRLQILDWEIYQLCRKLIRKYGNKKDLIYRALRERYFEDIASNRDVYLFLGTTKYWHIRRSNNPFVIIGVFYPPL